MATKFQDKTLSILPVIGIISYLALFSHSSLYVPYALSLLVVILLPKRVNIRLTVADKAIILFLGYVILRCSFQICTTPVKSLCDISSYTLLCVIYLVLVHYVRGELYKYPLGRCIQIIALVFVIWSTLNFLLLKYESAISGFCSVYHLRYLNKPWGYINNGYIIIAVSLFTMSFATKGVTTKSLSLLTICVLISFSKGAIVAYAMFLISLWVTRRISYTHILTIFAVTVSFYILFRADFSSFVKDAVSYTDSGSFRWRTTDVMYPRQFWESIFGYGIGSYSFCKEIYDAGTFTITAPNIASMIWTELGLVGCVIFVCMLIAVLSSGKQTCNKDLIISYIIFVMVKECTQGIMLAYFNIMATFIITTGILLRSGTSQKINAIAIPKPFAIYTVSMGIVIMLIKSCYQRHIEELPFEQKISHISEHNPEDLYPVIISSVSSAPTNGAVTDRLLRNNPYISLVNAKTSYSSGDTIEAVQLLHEAVLRMPSLLHSDFLNEMLKDDPVIAESLRVKLISESNLKTSDPKDTAKYGYILSYYDIPEGKLFLWQAIKKNPSLSTPWLLLGDLQKYSFLNYSGHTMSSPSTNHFQEYDLYECLCRYYAIKVKVWYGFDL